MTKRERYLLFRTRLRYTHSSQLPSGGWLFFTHNQNEARREIGKKYASNSRRGSVHREIRIQNARNSR